MNATHPSFFYPILYIILGGAAVFGLVVLVDNIITKRRTPKVQYTFRGRPTTLEERLETQQREEEAMESLRRAEDALANYRSQGN